MSNLCWEWYYKRWKCSLVLQINCGSGCTVNVKMICSILSYWYRLKSRTFGLFLFRVVLVYNVVSSEETKGFFFSFCSSLAKQTTRFPHSLQVWALSLQVLDVMIDRWINLSKNCTEDWESSAKSTGKPPEVCSERYSIWENSRPHFSDAVQICICDRSDKKTWQ